MQLLDSIHRQLLGDLSQEPLAPFGDDLLHFDAIVAPLARRDSAPRASSSRST